MSGKSTRRARYARATTCSGAISTTIEVKERKASPQIELTTKKVKPRRPHELLAAARRVPARRHPDPRRADRSRRTLEQACSSRSSIDIADALRAGATLRRTRSPRTPTSFPTYYVGILRSAELTGNLDSVLDQLADYIERDLEARRAVKSALTYPLVICVMAVSRS